MGIDIESMPLLTIPNWGNSSTTFWTRNQYKKHVSNVQIKLIGDLTPVCEEDRETVTGSLPDINNQTLCHKWQQPM